jgi:hypothetical protein
MLHNTMGHVAIGLYLAVAFSIAWRHRKDGRRE